jgi:hypothetical protein
MANEYTNYGLVFRRLNDSGSYVSIGDVLDLDYPGVSNPAVEYTHHSSGGRREFVSGRLVELTEFKATINDVYTSCSVILTDVTSGSLRGYQIVNPIPNAATWTFYAITTLYKPLKTDATKPDVSKVEVTFRPSGSSVLA